MADAVVIFDLDGTLLDTIGDIADSMNAALHHMGLPGHAVDAYKTFVGEGMELLVRRSLPEGLRDEHAVSTCLEHMKREYGQRWRHKTRPFEHIPELLDLLTHKGVRMAVLSNKPDAFTRKIVAAVLGSWQFHTVLGMVPGTPRKPDPLSALAIAHALRVEPSGCLFVGDSSFDMITAVRAGMLPVGVLWGYQDRDTLISSGAASLLADPLELLPLLQGE